MNRTESNDQDLSRTLADWQLAPTHDAQFRARVWQRIGSERSGSWMEYARLHAPALTGALVMALLVGGWLGREQARERVSADRAHIVAAYVEALDARAMRMP